MNYTISFELNGEGKSENFEADKPGEAFALCLKKYPDAKLTGASAGGGFGEYSGFTHYDPPPVQRQPVRIRTGPRKPRKNEPYGSFPF